MKIWFQNRRSKYKKLVKQHGGDNQTAAASLLLSETVNDSVAEDVCATPRPPSSSSPPSPTPPVPMSSHVDKLTRSTTALPPEVDRTEMTSSFDQFRGVVQSVDSLSEVISTQSAQSVGDWRSALGAWRTDVVEPPPPYSCWSTYGLHSSTTGSGLNQHGGRVWPVRSADQQWVPMSGFDRRYGSGLVTAQPWYAGYTTNTRHTSPV